MVAINTITQAALLGASTVSAASLTQKMEIEVQVDGSRKSLPEPINGWRLLQEWYSDGCAARLTIRPSIGNHFHINNDRNSLLMQDKTRDSTSTALVHVNLPGNRQSPLSSTNFVTTTCNDDKYDETDKFRVVRYDGIETLQWGEGSFIACPNYVLGLGHDYEEIYLGYREEGKDPLPQCADVTLYPLWREEKEL